MSMEEQEDEIPLTFEAWVDLSARLLKLDQDAKEKLLEDSSLDVHAWSECDRHYGLMLAADLRTGRMDRAQAYAGRFTKDTNKTVDLSLASADAPKLEGGSQ